MMFPVYFIILMTVLNTSAQLDGSFWWKSGNVQVKSLKSDDYSAKIRTLSPNINFDMTTGSTIFENYNDDDLNDEDMFKINNNPDCVCVQINLCQADQATSTNLCSKKETCCKPSGILKSVNPTPSQAFSLNKRSRCHITSPKSGIRTGRIHFPDELHVVSPAEYENNENMAIIFRKEPFENKILCSGVLLNQRSIVSVAHCSKEFIRNLTNIYIKIGNFNEPSTKNNSRLVTKVIVHPQFFSGGLYNDVAIIQFHPFDHDESSICLPPNITTFDGPCTLISLKENNSKHVDLVDVSQCQTLIQGILGKRFKLHSSFICGIEKKDCGGSGGDGLFCSANNKFYLAGLVSWGLDCNLPGVYTNIVPLVEWIENNL